MMGSFRHSAGDLRVGPLLSGRRWAAIPFADSFWIWVDDLEVAYRTFTPVTALVERIYQDRLGLDAHRLLRQPILVNYELSPFERAYVRVQAKRTRFVNSIKGAVVEHFLASELKGYLARPMIQKNDGRYGRFHQDRKIECRVYGAQGEILATGKNCGGRVRPWHAELRALRELELRNGPHFQLGVGTIIEVDLKPCKMCAQLIVEMSADPQNVSVRYQEPDFGCNSRYTALDQMAMSKPGIQFLAQTGNLK